MIEFNGIEFKVSYDRSPRSLEYGVIRPHCHIQYATIDYYLKFIDMVYFLIWRNNVLQLGWY